MNEGLLVTVKSTSPSSLE